MPNPVFNISDPEGGSINNGDHISVGMFSEDPDTSSQTIEQTLYIPAGWSIFSTYIDVDSDHGAFNDYGKGIDDFLVGIGFDTKADGSSGNIIIAKNNLGAAYLPEYNFNGIGDMENGQGYQIKLEEGKTITIEGNPITVTEGNNVKYGMHMDFVAGWNMIGVPHPLVTSLQLTNLNFDIHTFFSEAYEPDTGIQWAYEIATNPAWAGVQERIIIVKDYLGNAYLPEWNFNGVGSWVAGHGYQVKVTEAFTIEFTSHLNIL